MRFFCIFTCSLDHLLKTAFLHWKILSITFENKTKNLWPYTLGVVCMWNVPRRLRCLPLCPHLVALVRRLWNLDENECCRRKWVSGSTPWGFRVSYTSCLASASWLWMQGGQPSAFPLPHLPHHNATISCKPEAVLSWNCFLPGIW